MADPQRLAVLKALTSLIEATVLTPYPDDTATMPEDLTGLVFRGRSVFGASDPETMISILEAPRPGAALVGGDGEARKPLWDLLLQGWRPEDPRNPCDPMYYMAEDVMAQLHRMILDNTYGFPRYPEHYMLGKNESNQYRIVGARIGDPIVSPPKDGVSSKSFFYLPLQVELARTFP